MKAYPRWDADPGTAWVDCRWPYPGPQEIRQKTRYIIKNDGGFLRGVGACKQAVRATLARGVGCYRWPGPSPANPASPKPAISIRPLSQGLGQVPCVL